MVVGLPVLSVPPLFGVSSTTSQPSGRPPDGSSTTSHPSGRLLCLGIDYFHVAPPSVDVCVLVAPVFEFLIVRVSGLSALSALLSPRSDGAGEDDTPGALPAVLSIMRFSSFLKMSSLV